MIKKFILSALIIFPLLLVAQEEQPKFGIKFSGYVKNDFFFDTRKTVDLLDGAFLLYPDNVRYDRDSLDINAQSSFNILAIQSRLRGDIFGPDAFGAKTSGVLEGEFTGTPGSSTNGFRLRHAFGRLSWEATDLVIGQTWHPLFVEGCFPEIMGINTGAPYQPFSRNPQIRIIQKFYDFQIHLAVMSQKDFTSWGGSGSLRYSSIPDMCLRLQYQKFNEDKTQELFFGVGAEYKILVPKLVTDSNYSTSTSVDSYAFMGFFKSRSKHITVKAQCTYGQNLYDQVMLGGYAYKYTTDSKQIERGDYDYTTINNVSAWADISTNGSKFQFGLFGGYGKNLGSQYNILNWESPTSYFSRGCNIGYIYRISPRVAFISGKVKMGVEGDYSVAGYGTTLNSLGDVQNITPVANFRLMYSFFYFF